MDIVSPSPFPGSAAGRDLGQPRHDWTRGEVAALFDLPFPELTYLAATVHRRWFDPAEVQISQLLSVKTGGCEEDCGYCSQSAHFRTGLKASKLMEVEAVVAEATRARDGGAGRFCMGAAWRELKDRDLPKLEAMVAGVKALGLETCATLGMLRRDQAERLRAAGLDYYNHNLDTSPEDYGRVVRTRTYDDRLQTLDHVRAAGLKTCCGGIVGMGEGRDARVGLLHALATLPAHPDSLPINALMPIPGTPLGDSAPVDGLEFVRTIAVARIVCPRAMVRLSAGRDQMSRELQALCFVAGANSIFVGGRLLTTPTPDEHSDSALLRDLGLRPMPVEAEPEAAPRAALETALA